MSRPGLVAVVAGLFSLEEQPGGRWDDCASPHAARWPEPWEGEHIDDPTAEWLDVGEGAAELAGVAS